MGPDGSIEHTALCVWSIDWLTCIVWAFVRVQIAKLWCKVVSVVCFACLSKVRGAFVTLGVVFSERKTQTPPFFGLNRSAMSM